METTSEQTKLSAKYEKFMVFSYWISQRIQNSDGDNSLEEMTCVFDNVNQQNELMNSFFEDYKVIQKMYKKQIRDNEKAMKPKLPPKEPQEQKKRGRKKKEVIDTRTEEEKLLDSIIANAQMIQNAE